MAEAKRRFSELIERVLRGERFLVSRRNSVVVAIVPPHEVSVEEQPSGLASVAGALEDWTELEEATRQIYAARSRSPDRDVPHID